MILINFSRHKIKKKIKSILSLIKNFFKYYRFFLQHLVNKDETEYTGKFLRLIINLFLGQETYIREKYDNRDWEFFPVGECFVKQYEDQLLQS